MGSKKKYKGFSLLEIMVAMVVFATLTVTSSGVLTYLSKAWRQKRSEYDVIHNARWALERMTSELRQSHVSALLKIIGGGGANTCNGMITSACDGIAAIASDSTQAIYFWREGTKLYQGRGLTFSAAVNNRQQLADYLYYNSSNTTDVKNGVFSSDSLERIYNIDITVRDTTVIKNGGPLEYKVSGRVRPQK